MSLDKEEKARLAQLGLDRRLAEAIGALDTEAATFIRIAGDENAEEAAIMQAASNYRAAVQRRNVAYDRACGVPEAEAGKDAASSVGIDSEALQKMIDEAVEGTTDEDALRAVVAAEVKAQLAAANAPGEGEKPAGSTAAPKKAPGG